MPRPCNASSSARTSAPRSQRSSRSWTRSSTAWLSGYARAKHSVSCSELSSLLAATARAPAGAQEPLALGGSVGPEALAQLGQPPDGARALENTACLAHARFTLCGRCRASSSWRAPKRKHSLHDSITSSARASTGVGTVSPSALAVLRLITRSYLVGAYRGRSPGFVPVSSVSHRFRHQPIGAALILFLKKHNNILSVYFSRLSSNCFPPYYIQPGRNILLLKIESSFQNQNKQKRLMSKLSCFARAASHLRPRRAKRHVHARPIHPVVCCSSIGRLGADAAPPSSVAKNLRRVT